ncbi:hypothetical protein ACHAXT_012254 [Thalassiosira profunda]
MSTVHQHQDGGPPAKRSRADDDGGGSVVAGFARMAWEHYRNFIDGGYMMEAIIAGAVPDGIGDVDELIELTELLEGVPPLDADPATISGDGASTALFGNLDSLLPTLPSISHLHLASHAITETMFDPNQPNQEGDDESSPEYHFEKSLHYWPTNPAAHSLLANYHRMNSLSTTEEICEHYEKAATYANRWRGIALAFLQSESDGQVAEGVNAKEWVELLVINGALDVEYIGEDDEEGEEEDGEGDADAEEQGEDGEQGEEYSSSGVECTASFMTAFLLSTRGEHEKALPYLQKFGLTHRIHPNVWKEAGMNGEAAIGAGTNDNKKIGNGKPAATAAKFLPRMYHEATGCEGGGVLPPHLYSRLCSVFAPDAAYWKESDYNNRGYYSYFVDLDAATDASRSVRERPTNVIEDAVVNHLLPLAERTLSENARADKPPPRIVGAEWWVHTRPLGANLGHQVHFDTDEGLLSREKRVTHPVVSSVLYLTGATENKSGAGATVVFDQTPDSKEVAPRAWLSHPLNNAFMTFSGDLLHGVLPCSGSGTKDSNNASRLTFMVGFWTRNVAEGMGERELYSPSGPLPPATADHTWVAAVQRGYCDDSQQSNGSGDEAQRDLAFDRLPSTAPAWEKFDAGEVADGSPLAVPKGLDHRFFVRGAPHCFSESLFENDDRF